VEVGTGTKDANKAVVESDPKKQKEWENIGTYPVPHSRKSSDILRREIIEFYVILLIVLYHVNHDLSV
jgi:hypothetical protein